MIRDRGSNRRLMVTCDGAGASPGPIARLDKLASRPGQQLAYSVGWDLGARERNAIALVPHDAWHHAIDGAGARRCDDACGDRSCAHRRCWVEEAHVTDPAPANGDTGLGAAPNHAHGSASASGAEVGSQQRGVLGEHPAILQASAMADFWRAPDRAGTSSAQHAARIPGHTVLPDNQAARL